MCVVTSKWLKTKEEKKRKKKEIKKKSNSCCISKETNRIENNI